MLLLLPPPARPGCGELAAECDGELQASSSDVPTDTESSLSMAAKREGAAGGQEGGGRCLLWGVGAGLGEGMGDATGDLRANSAASDPERSADVALIGEPGTGEPEAGDWGLGEAEEGERGEIMLLNMLDRLSPGVAGVGGVDSGMDGEESSTRFRRDR